MSQIYILLEGRQILKFLQFAVLRLDFPDPKNGFFVEEQDGREPGDSGVGEFQIKS